MFKLVLSLAFVAVTLGVPHKGLPARFTGNRIVGGEEARIEDFPYQVSLRYYDEHWCGGSIIDEFTILTAAHCTDGLRAAKMSIMVGSENVNDGKVHQVADILQHPLFNDNTYDFDMSILKLDTPISFNSKASPIDLQDDDDTVPGGTVATVSGWGALFEGDEETPEILRKVNVDVLSDSDCKNSFGSGRVTDRMMCASRLGKDSCQGDSGGPLVANGKLIGVVSWGIGCARPHYPGLYAKVSYLRSWIDQNI